MIESPILDELIAKMTAKAMHRLLFGVLEKKYGPIPSEIKAYLGGITDDKRLEQINEFAALCPNLDDFRQKLGS